MAVPLLFANASSPAVAGTLAAKLFAGQSWLGLVCGLLILMGARNDDDVARMDWAQGALVVVLLGMLTALLSQFVVAPRIVARANLQLWHSLGTLLYAAQWLCALAALWKISATRLSPPAAS
ncbi:MAG: DUF4149 domain-containing protein [Comamonadaceae bacterium]|nr:MAG: DUF4149 domain-containing protein [Comamonadaceae bacterium]